MENNLSTSYRQSHLHQARPKRRPRTRLLVYNIQAELPKNQIYIIFKLLIKRLIFLVLFATRLRSYIHPRSSTS